VRTPRLLAGLLLALFAALCLGSMAQQSVTGDEVAHLPSGYTYVRTGDFRLNMQHPPLVKAMAGIPLLLLDLKPVTGAPGWEERDEWTFGRDFLTHNRTPTRTIVFLARLPPLLIGLLLCVYVYRWGRELWGEWAGVFTLALCVFCPNVLAHTPLVTTDVGLAAFSVMSLYYLWRYSRSGHLRDVFWSALGLGLALLAKYSAVISVALVAALLPVAWWGGGGNDSKDSKDSKDNNDSRDGVDGNDAAGATEGRDGDAVARGDGGGGARPLAQLLVAALLLVIVPAALITLGFGFPWGLANYYRGFSIIHADLNPYWQAFLWGEYSRDGFWYYYLLAQWWKTPIPTLLFFSAALLLVPLPGTAESPSCKPARSLTRRAPPATPIDHLFLLLPLVAFHGAGLLYKSSIGVRHVLPAFPFLFLAAGAAAVWVGRRRLPDKVVFAALCAWLALGTLRAYPHFIPYFNAFAGGPAHGIEYLDDSNIEWGQDFDNLKRYIDAHELERVRLSAFKAFRPERYGISYEFMGLQDVVWPQEGITYFTGASYLQRNSLFNEHPGVRFEWLKRYRPVDHIGWSIYVYRFSTDEADRGRAGVVYVPRERWYADAIEQLSGILGRSPKFAEARQVLAKVYAHRAAWHDGKRELEAAALDRFRAARPEPLDAGHRRAWREARDRLLQAPAGEDAGRVPQYYLEAFVADQQQNPDEAVKYYLRCLRLDPDHLGALYNLGQLFARSGFGEMAVQMWRRCLEVQPGYVPALQSLAQVQQSLRGQGQ